MEFVSDDDDDADGVVERSLKMENRRLGDEGLVREEDEDEDAEAEAEDADEGGADASDCLAESNEAALLRGD